MTKTCQTATINKGCKTTLELKGNICSFVIIVLCLQSVTSFLMAETEGDARRIWSVAGRRADLPCQTNPRRAEDRPVLVLWYRQSMSKPVYSYDARLGNFSSGERWYNRTLFGERAYFVPLARPPALVLEPVMPYDEGLYTCRLDYLDSPTTSSSTHLSVIIFPDPPEILWKGHQVFGPIGPLKEGSFHRLICLTRAGRPPPSLIWWLEGHRAMNQVQEEGDDGEMRSILTIRASRDVNMKSLSCHAQIRWDSVPIAQPLTASVRLNVSLPPVGIDIEGGERLVAVDTTLSLVCLTWGSHPPAQITWWRAGKKLKSYSYHVKDGGNLTTSEIKVVVDASDHGATFTCQASNTLIGGLPLVASRRLNVTYRPSVELRVKVSNKFISKSRIISAKLRTVTVKQGSNVQFECSSDANPVPNFIEWHQNGVIIDAGKEAWSLLLQRVTKEKSGFYSCAATNSAGRGISVAYSIVVEHPPECSTGWLKRTQGTEIGRSVTVLCRVEALPFSDLSFSWSKLSKEGSEQQFNDTQLQTDGTTSRLTFTPNSLKDFGTLLCRAKNSVGFQERPCQVTLVPASCPDPPFNCSTDTGNGAGSLSVACLEGFDGGFPQKFILVAIQKGKVGANITRDFPEWSLQNLEYGKPVTLRVYAYNTRGRSESVRLEFFIPIPEVMSDQDVKETGGGPFFGDQRTTIPIVGILVGAGGVLAMASLVILFFFCSSRRRLFSCLSKMSPRPSPVNERQSHTFFFSPLSNFNQRESSAATLSKPGMPSNPDIVNCIQHGPETSSKRLDVIPLDSQLLHPLIATYNQPDFGSQHFSNVSKVTSQSDNPNMCDCFERSDIKESIFNSNVVTADESEKSLTEDSCLEEKDSLSSKGAIPKRIVGQDEHSFNSHCKKKNVRESSSNQKDVLYRTSPSAVKMTAFPYTSSFYSCHISEGLNSNRDHCYDCSTDSRHKHSLVLSNGSTDSLTYSNACCVEHYGPYYIYKHVKCYPHKNYRPYEEFAISHQQPTVPYSYTPKKTPLQDPQQHTPNKVNMDDVSTVPEDQFQENFYEQTKTPQIYKPERNLNQTDSKCWNVDCGNIICGGGNKHSKEKKKKRKMSHANDIQLSTYKKFEAVCPNEASLNLAAVKNNEVNCSKVPIHIKPNDPGKLKPHRKARVPLSLSEENLKFDKNKPTPRVPSSLSLSRVPSKYPVYEPSFQVIRDQKELDKLKYERISTESSHRPKEISNSQLYKKREHQKLQKAGKNQNTELFVSVSNEQLKIKRREEDTEKNEQALPSSKESGAIKTDEIAPASGPSIDPALQQTIKDSASFSEPCPTISTAPKSQTSNDSNSSTKENTKVGSTVENFPKRSPKQSKTVTVSKSEVKMDLDLRSSLRTAQPQGQPLPLKSILRSKRCK